MAHHRRATATLLHRVLLCCLLFTSPAFAGSYLSRTALLIDQSKHESAYLRRHLGDIELARVVHQLCLGRLRAARDMLVPKEVKLAHPHVMSMLENYERAADAAVRKSPEGYLTFSRSAQDEELIFKTILDQNGWKLPATE